MSGWLWPALLAAGGLGALARDGLSSWVQRRLDTPRPYGTAVVNLAGAALLAATIAAWRGGLLAHDGMILVGAGFSAGFTTFSTWMLEAVHLAGSGAAGRRAAAIGLAGPLAAGVLAAAAVLAW